MPDEFVEPGDARLRLELCAGRLPCQPPRPIVQWLCRATRCAAIALGVHIRASAEARDDLRVRSALGELLTDPASSRIRYRAAEVVRSSPALIATYRDDLEHLAGTDTNRYVRNMAANALRRQRG